MAEVLALAEEVALAASAVVASAAAVQAAAGKRIIHFENQMFKLKQALSICVYFLSVSFVNSQSDFIQGKWYVLKKTAQTDLEVPTRILFSRDSVHFNSMDVQDSMQCSEVFIFDEDATLIQSGNCLPLDSTHYGFKYYGINGSWMFLDKNTLLIDYYFGLSLYHCIFNFRIINDGFELKRKHMDVQEM
jgi:hypothetical protein